jgi:hypothetical protein
MRSSPQPCRCALTQHTERIHHAPSCSHCHPKLNSAQIDPRSNLPLPHSAAHFGLPADPTRPPAAPRRAAPCKYRGRLGRSNSVVLSTVSFGSPKTPKHVESLPFRAAILARCVFVQAAHTPLQGTLSPGTRPRVHDRGDITCRLVQGPALCWRQVMRVVFCIALVVHQRPGRLLCHMCCCRPASHCSVQMHCVLSLQHDRASACNHALMSMFTRLAHRPSLSGRVSRQLLPRVEYRQPSLCRVTLPSTSKFVAGRTARGWC